MQKAIIQHTSKRESKMAAAVAAVKPKKRHRVEPLTDTDSEVSAPTAGRKTPLADNGKKM